MEGLAPQMWLGSGSQGLLQFLLEVQIKSLSYLLSIFSFSLSSNWSLFQSLDCWEVNGTLIFWFILRDWESFFSRIPFKIEVFLPVRNLIQTCFNTKECVALQHYMKEKDGVLAGKLFVIIVDKEEGTSIFWHCGFQDLFCNDHFMLKCGFGLNPRHGI